MRNSEKTSQTALVALAAIYIGGTWPGLAAMPSANPTLKTLWSFNGSTSSASSLAPGNSGELYGTTPLDGPYFSGTVFELKPPARLGGAWTKTVIYNFMGGNDGDYPSILPMTPSGALYGTAGGGPVSSVCTFGCGMVFQLTPPSTPGGAWTKTTLYTFTGGNDGYGPVGVIPGANGVLYGATSSGGAANAGTVFRLTPPAAQGDSWTESVIYTFAGGADGSGPTAVAVGANGTLYGETYGGPSMYGTAYQLSPQGAAGGVWTKTILYNFANGSEGGLPSGGLSLGANGLLYGTTREGGVPSAECTQGCGTVFQLTPPATAGNAWTETVLYNFLGGSDGVTPGGVLIANGALYGATVLGGSAACLLGCGTVFQLNPPAAAGGAWTEAILYSFAGFGDSANPASLFFDSNKNLDGLTSDEQVFSSGAYDGTIFQLEQAASAPWTENILYHMGQTSDGATPANTPLLFDASGAMYGITQAGGAYACLSVEFPGCGIVFKLTPSGHKWTRTILYNFSGGSDGRTPTSLVRDGNGALYGTTSQGGAADDGTVFQLTPPGPKGGAWTETVLYRFAGGSDGKYPNFLAIGPDGALYGTTSGGGMSSPAQCTIYGPQGGCGTVFQLTPPAVAGGTWTKTTIYKFSGGTDGLFPESLAFWNGTLYGTTNGESNTAGADTNGTVFQLTPPASGTSWTQTILYYFEGGDAGRAPAGGLLFDANGAVYGSAYGGPGCRANYGCGLVFSLTPPAVAGGAWAETVLYTFKGHAKGYAPVSLAFKNGTLVGAAAGGGSYVVCQDGCGTLFQLSPKTGGSWTMTILHTFTGDDGAYPQGLALHGGKLYGTASAGRTDYGTVFQLTF
jgi:uncharacterized repeat protein (TIGR03803 family)